MVWQHHGEDLHCLDVVGVVAQDPRQLDLPDLVQLLQGEAAGPASVLVPEAIAVAEGAELLADDAGKCRAHHGAGQGLLGDSSRPQIDIIGRFVDGSIGRDSVVAKNTNEVAPTVDAGEATPLTPGSVRGNSMITTTLNVDSSQVKAELLARLLEEMVGHLLSDRVIVRLGHLVDQAKDISVCPSSLVQIVRLLQHLTKSLRGNIAMGLAPALNSGRQESVSEAEGSSSKGLGNSGIDAGVIDVSITILVEDKLMAVHNLLAKNHGEELIVGDVLHYGGHDVAGLMEDSLIIPVGVDLSQLTADPVVLTDKEGVDKGQDSLFIDTSISSKETVDIFRRPDASLIWILELQWQQRFHAELLENWQHFHLTTLEGSQGLGSLLLVGVDSSSIQIRAELIESISGTEAAVVAESWGRADKVHAPLVMLGEEWISRWNLNGQAVGVGGALTALGGLASLGVTSLRGESDVVIDELAPGDEDDGDGVIVEALIRMGQCGNQSRRGQLATAASRGSGGAQTVGVIGCLEAVESHHGRSPVRLLQVVAHAGVAAVPLHLALLILQKFWAVAGDDGLGGVDQGQPAGHSIGAKPVLVSQVPASLLDDGAQVGDVLRLELPARRRQADGGLGGLEGGVDGGVGDA